MEKHRLTFQETVAKCEGSTTLRGTPTLHEGAHAEFRLGSDPKEPFHNDATFHWVIFRSHGNNHLPCLVFFFFGEEKAKCKPRGQEKSPMLQEAFLTSGG